MTDIAVYADWDGLVNPCRLGMLFARRASGREVFEFQMDAGALRAHELVGVALDPAIQAYPGPQYPQHGHDTFGAFSDVSPDRWGRLLMRRRLERAQKSGHASADARLYESDYLLDVHDTFRAGALRFRLNDEGDFLDHQAGVAAPPFVQLRDLEAASLALEKDKDNSAAAGDDWLRMLIAPGGSLGGARPKASVVDPDGGLWIAKFPSARDDEFNVGAWEMVVHTLARGCGLRLPDSQIDRFASEHHTFLVKRFDRTTSGRRLHFASAMTLTGHKDGEDAAAGASYLEIAEVLITQGAQPTEDLRELWSRIVFNILVSNTDDHLRNHGFILVPGTGWRLSEAYDMNPVADGSALKLNISEADNDQDLDLARSVAPYFRVGLADANDIIDGFKHVVRQWAVLAADLGISRREQQRMARAFRLAA